MQQQTPSVQVRSLVEKLEARGFYFEREPNGDWKLVVGSGINPDDDPDVREMFVNHDDVSHYLQARLAHVETLHVLPDAKGVH